MLTIGTLNQAISFVTRNDAVAHALVAGAECPAWAYLTPAPADDVWVLAIVAQGGADEGTVLGWLTREEGVADVERPSDLTGTRTH